MEEKNIKTGMKKAPKARLDGVIEEESKAQEYPYIVDPLDPLILSGNSLK